MDSISTHDVSARSGGRLKDWRYSVVMSDLLVKREGLFHGVSIRMVFDSGPGKPLHVAFRARDAEWFAPDQPGATADGWVRDFDPGSVEGELEFGFATEQGRQDALEQLTVWQETPPERLTGVSSLLHQYVGFVDCDTKIGVGVKMDMDSV